MKKILIILEMIKFEHTVFALPFALMGTWLAARGWPGWYKFTWIIIAMAGARSAAMAFNRFADLKFDAKNPRTSSRALPKGRIKIREIILFIIISSVLFCFAAYMLNPLCFILSPIALAIVLLYSYTKRFTPLCHLFLGLAVGLAPFGGWVAITGSISFLSILLSVGILFWIAGFDILYACQDVEFDRTEGLKSIPALLGGKKAFNISAMFHFITFCIFLLVGIIGDLNAGYFIVMILVGIFLFIEHRVISPDNMKRIDLAFFTINGAISIAMFTATILGL